MNKAWELKKGFTVIELLVVIVVIGILTSITIVTYSSIQQRSRDSRRDSDTTQIKIAIEKFHSDKSMYPASCGDNTSCPISSLAVELSSYLKTVPHDPINTVNSIGDYQYIRGAVTDDSYALLVSYEAKAVCKTGLNINTTWWSTSYPSC